MSKYKSEQISLALKEAREKKAFSQRDLAAKSGVPQGHISKIENGAVDLRVSSLIALARVLDMELALVPRKNVAAVNSIVRSGERQLRHLGSEALVSKKEMELLRRSVRALPEMPDYTKYAKEVGQLDSRIRELSKLKIPKTYFADLEKINKSIVASATSTSKSDAIKKSILQTDKLRNILAHSAVQKPDLKIPKPAYSLDEDD